MNLKGAPARLEAAVLDVLQGDRVLLWGLALALAVRLVVLPFFSDPLNFFGYHLTASFAEGGLNPWISIAADPAVAHFNPWGYPPAYLVPVIAADGASLGNGYVFGLLIRVPLILSTLLTATLLFRTGRELGLDATKARALALAYAFCPFTVFVDTIWGANDPLAVMFTAAAVYFAVRREPRYELAALFLGLGIAFKLYPVVLVPLLAAAVPTWAGRLKVIVLAAIPGALTAGPVLAASPVEFLRTLGLFVVGGGTDSATSSFPWIMSSQAGVRDPLFGTALIAAYMLGLVALAVLVRRGRVTFVQASAVAVMALFLVAPRLNQNYFLWALPFIFTAAALGMWPRLVRFVATLSWTPLAALAVIYNGAAGITGLYYWGLVADAPHGQPYKLFPLWTPVVLVGLFLAMVAFSVAVLLLRGQSPGATPPRGWDLPRIAQGIAKRTGVLLAAALSACLVFAALVASLGANVLPGDFGTYSTRDHTATVTDEFNSALFGFTYDYEGSGFFSLNETGSGSMEVDTVEAGANAFFTRALPNQTVTANLRVRLERMDGTPGLLVVARIPHGWVGAQPLAGQTHLVFYDEVTDVLQDFGPVNFFEPLEITIKLSPQGNSISYGGNTAYGTGGPVSKITLGHYDVVPYGGGRVAFDRLTLSWQADPRGETPAVVAATLGGTVAALAAPIWFWRARRT